MNKDFIIKNWKAYYINLDSRKEKRIAIENRLKSQNIKAERFSALKDEDASKFPNFKLANTTTSGEWGCAFSHYSILKKHFNSKDPRILAIFEDDALFCKDFSKRLNYLSENFNLEWDVFYLGSFCKLLHDKKTKIKNVWQIKDVVCGTQAMLINPGSISKILQLLEKFAPKASATDNLYCLLFPYLKVYCFVPGMVAQDDKFSGNIGQGGKSTKLFIELYGEHVFSETLEQFDYKKTTKIYFFWKLIIRKYLEVIGKMGQFVEKRIPYVYKKLKPFFPTHSF